VFEIRQGPGNLDPHQSRAIAGERGKKALDILWRKKLRRHLDADAPDLLLSVSEQSGPDGAELGMSVFFLSKVAKL
jgi:hypothetical protein